MNPKKNLLKMKRLIYIAPLFLFSACADELDSTNKILTPTITSPAAFANVSGEVTVKTLVTPEDQFSSLELLLDGETVATLTENPASFAWQTDGLTDAHTILAIAKNKDGDSYQSEKVTVYIEEESEDNINPFVNITSPASFVTIDGDVTISATAHDDSGIERVIFYTNGDSLTELTSEPYTYVWDTNGLSGTYSITARAYDTSGNFAEAYPASVTVNPKDEFAPTVYIAQPANFDKVEGIVKIVASASDNKGVENVVFYIDSDSVGVDSEAPYEYSWDTNGLSGTFAISAKATDLSGNFSFAYPASVEIEEVIPYVQILSPAQFEILTGQASIVSQIEEIESVDSLRFFVDGVFTEIAFQNLETINYNTNLIPNGNHTFLVKVFAGEQVQNSQVVTVVIQN
ncbi:MAG: hypothetical protein DWQ06_16285 [Calditrichaeota bacterium]|nr:MAG: hypothetical protein DWQ06_16285 [Calditrichota bacterium]